MAGTLILNFLTEEKSGDGISIWTKAYRLDPMYITNIQISTTGQLQPEPYGDSPTITVLGIKDRIAKITGTFVPKSKSTLADLLKINSESNDLTPMIQNNNLGYGVSVFNWGIGGVNILNGKWRLKSLTYDRNAAQMGKYIFTMELSYLWNVNNVGSAETQIFDPSVGTTKIDNIQFVANINGLPDIPIYNVNIHRTLMDKNVATFDTKIEVNQDQVVYINMYNDNEYVFYGIVKEFKRGRDGINNVTCYEISELLYRTGIKNPKPGLFKPRVIMRNPYKGTYQTMGKLIKEILSYFVKYPYNPYNPGYGVEKPAQHWSEKTDIPGRTGVKFPSQLLSGVSVGTAIRNFIRNQCGMYFWFDYNSNGQLQYGFIRDKQSVVPSTDYFNSELYESAKKEYPVEYVVVSNNEGIIGYAGNPNIYSSGDSKTQSERGVYYRLSDSKNDRSLSQIAESILTDLNLDNSKYKVKFNAGVIKFKEGDVFTGLGDYTLGRNKMKYLSGTDVDPTENPGDSVWQVKEVYITNTGTEVIVGSSYQSIFNIYGSALTLVRDGIPTPTETKSESRNAISTTDEMTYALRGT